MKKALSIFLMVALGVGGAPLETLSQQPTTSLVGVVRTAQGTPVPGIKIIAKDTAGKVLGEAITDAEGRYTLEKLSLGEYHLTLDPSAHPFMGATVVTSLDEAGLTVDWIVSETAPAIALATPGVGDTRLAGAIFSVVTLAGLIVATTTQPGSVGSPSQ